MKHPTPRLGGLLLLLPLLPAWLLALATPAVWAASWTQEGRGPGATSLAVQETALTAGNLGQLQVLWSGDLDVWDQATDIAAADGHAFIGRQLADPDPDTGLHMQLLSFDLETGRMDWQTDAPDFFWTPAVTQELVIVAGTGLEEVDGRVRVVAYERKTGVRRWEYRTPAARKVGSFRAPHLLDGVLYLVSDDGHLFALDAATGALRWSRDPAGTAMHHGLAVAGQRLFVSDFNGTSAYDVADGRPLWRYDLQSLFRSQTQRPMVVGGTVLLFDYSGELRALDPASGGLKWSTVTPPGRSPGGYHAMASDGERVFVVNGLTRGQLSAVALASGQVLWSVDVGRNARNPVAANGVLYLPATTLKAFDARSGEALPIAPLRSPRNTEIIVVDGKLLASGGPVMAIGLPQAADRAPALP